MGDLWNKITSPFKKPIQKVEDYFAPAPQVRVRDVVPITDSDGRPNVQLHVNGKTGARVVIPRASSAAMRCPDRMLPSGRTWRSKAKRLCPSRARIFI